MDIVLDIGSGTNKNEIFNPLSTEEYFNQKMLISIFSMEMKEFIKKHAFTQWGVVL